ncbi:hypothetical protein MHM84_03205 [Halomonas sp. McH1-25]|uniref:ORC-CDC6 family AAA ATPase n=1 Tax=unclassified Halomonas TaxID=2609666 RepID=UPI001EF45809|nr:MULTISPECIES: hypothetical protein [unclassified Halomonas]MCG7598783.1 hypothetical protein [Halomonas sp. McH1-25]MCP1340746.1 hypothetical protein [Halomonas sp. FL8]MCP1359517.1 hypothetical protein [Halomonas sp. BBD45]MCP1363867.1 hypothetical protein [Halomonas sp. BBD48]
MVRYKSIHDSFNARNLTISALCEGFIVNDHFLKLSGPDHAIMVGPRGSGKTTLMKMLQVEALSLWESDDAETFRKKIDFTGVFIPTDRLWKMQYESIVGNNEWESARVDSLNSIFIYHVLERFVLAVEYRSKRSLNDVRGFRRVNLSKKEEVSLVNDLARSWRVKPKMLTLKGLALELAMSKHELSGFSLSAEREPEKEKKSPFFDIKNIAGLLDVSVKIVNSHIDEDGGKWCFLFDELELAPESIVQPLINALRGGPEDIILKLSLSPYHGDIKVTDNPNSPMDRQDHSFINLSSSNDRIGFEFSKKLCQKLFDRHGYSKTVESYFEEPKRKPNKIVFLELEKKDPTFKDYLMRNNIDATRLELYTEKNKLPIIRKVQFIAQLRNEFLSYEGRLKSKKRALDYYAGFDKICKAVEYNPRMLIGVFSMLLDAMVDNKISVSEQIKSLKEILNSYSALLNTISIEVAGSASLLEMVDKLAIALASYIKGGDFYSETYGYFCFHKDPGEEVKRAVGYALNSGAFVIDDSDAHLNGNIGDIESVRFRLSYIFSHKYGLVMSKPRELDFMKALSGDLMPNGLSPEQIKLL